MADQYSGAAVSTLQDQFKAYIYRKTPEIEEARVAVRYASGVQWSDDQIAALRKRKQPVITFNRVTRKIDGIIGTVRRMRADPKAYARTQAHEQGAELATQVVRFVCDEVDFESIEQAVSRDACIFGFAVSEMLIVGSDGADPEIELRRLDPRTFFYDPRSVEPDFSDARYMGVYKWVTRDEIDEIAPGASAQLGDGDNANYQSTAQDDTDKAWDEFPRNKVKLVDHWYIQGGKWRYCLFAGNVKLKEGESPFFDDKGRSLCKFNPFSYAIDQDGDRYGMVRDLKGPQDAINQHRSKSVWIMNARQVIAKRGALDDVELARKEAMRPDGVIEFNGDPGDFRFDQPAQEFLQQTQYFADAKAEIENFGPNIALVGTQVTAKSGRAMAMMQQSGLAEIGPFLGHFRQWRLRTYRMIWWTVKRYWSSQRWLRVTDDEEAAQFIEVNRLTIDEMGQPVIVNALGQLDVDVTLDEGPDTENVQGDVYDSLMALAQNGVPVPPAVIIEMSNLPASTKRKIMALLDQAKQPDPATEEAKRIALEGEVAKTEKTRADARKSAADAMKTETEIVGNVAAMTGEIMPAAAPMFVS